MFIQLEDARLHSALVSLATLVGLLVWTQVTLIYFFVPFPIKGITGCKQCSKTSVLELVCYMLFE